MILKTSDGKVSGFIAMCDKCEEWASDPLPTWEEADAAAKALEWVWFDRDGTRHHQCPDCLRTPSFVECCACRPVLVEA